MTLSSSTIPPSRIRYTGTSYMISKQQTIADQGNLSARHFGKNDQNGSTSCCDYGAKFFLPRLVCLPHTAAPSISPNFAYWRLKCPNISASQSRKTFEQAAGTPMLSERSPASTCSPHNLSTGRKMGSLTHKACLCSLEAFGACLCLMGTCRGTENFGLSSDIQGISRDTFRKTNTSH